jgi:hypothetical protein
MFALGDPARRQKGVAKKNAGQKPGEVQQGGENKCNKLLAFI